MTRTDINTQHSHNSEQPLNQVHEIQNTKKRESLEQSNDNMQDIVNHLTTLRYYLNHQEAFVMDELADWCREANVGKGTEYRHSRIKH